MNDPTEQTQDRVSTGIGCALVFPVTFFGTLMIADYPGPPGPIGLVEFLGWWAVCLAIAYSTGWLLLQFRKRRAIRLLFLLSALGMPIILGLLTWWDIQPSTPTHVKQTVEYSFQAVGIGALAAVVVFFVWIARNRRKT